MSIFGFGKPKWYKILPENFQPDENNIQEIENFRSELSIDHKVLTQMITMTPWAVEKLQWFMFKKFKAEEPRWSERKIWEAVIISRMNIKLMTADYTADSSSFPLTRSEINDIINRVESIVRDFNNFNDVVNYLVQIDRKENRFYDPSHLLEELNYILENRRR